jgi:hypothetical protein
MSSSEGSPVRPSSRKKRKRAIIDDDSEEEVEIVKVVKASETMDSTLKRIKSLGMCDGEVTVARGKAIHVIDLVSDDDVDDKERGKETIVKVSKSPRAAPKMRGSSKCKGRLKVDKDKVPKQTGKNLLGYKSKRAADSSSGSDSSEDESEAESSGGSDSEYTDDNESSDDNDSSSDDDSGSSSSESSSHARVPVTRSSKKKKKAEVVTNKRKIDMKKKGNEKEKGKKGKESKKR